MIIADRLRQLRLEKNLSQGDIRERTGLLRCYISRVENGYTVPSFETAEKFARALEVPMYVLFYDGEGPPKLPRQFPKSNQTVKNKWGESGADARSLAKFRDVLGRMEKRNRSLLLSFARHMAKAKDRER